MKYNRKLTRLALPVVVCLVMAVSLVKLSSGTVGTIGKADLSGNWLVTLYGQGGCGQRFSSGT